jgi:hypothetical protein
VGDRETAQTRYNEFLTVWKNANPDRPEIVAVKKFLEARLMVRFSIFTFLASRGDARQGTTF